jgi:hypothetical protein
MQNAKDSFYLALRNRLVVVNPARTMLLRGVLRPSILVEEAEPYTAKALPDLFLLRWTALAQNQALPEALVTLECEIHYVTDGTQTGGGLDRGRMLEKMDADLTAMLAPPSTPKQDSTQTPAVVMQTLVFWTDPVFTASILTRDRIGRVATVTVYSYQEQGEA